MAAVACHARGVRGAARRCLRHAGAPCRLHAPRHRFPTHSCARLRACIAPVPSASRLKCWSAPYGVMGCRRARLYLCEDTCCQIKAAADAGRLNQSHHGPLDHMARHVGCSGTGPPHWAPPTPITALTPVPTAWNQRCLVARYPAAGARKRDCHHCIGVSPDPGRPGARIVCDGKVGALCNQGFSVQGWAYAGQTRPLPGAAKSSKCCKSERAPL